ncbi:MAG: hypothetical protein GC180_07510 [Bacteroidetes bacterium]|nr:hypothetical protein [Bacteroidota bacterium]
MGLKETFAINKKSSVLSDDNQHQASEDIAQISGASYTAKGTRDAGFVGGSSKALLPKLQSVYMQLSRYIQMDAIKQAERKNKIRQEISTFEAKTKNLTAQITTEKEKLNHEEGKIIAVSQEIDHIKENPQTITGESIVKVSLWIGIVILFVLTIYLFVFYSSAAFSAFFKDFTPDDTKITQAIFDAQAVNKAFQHGVLELVFILAIPAIFLGLGFLIHKFSEEKSKTKYLKIVALIAVTFAFDFILAYVEFPRKVIQ